MDTAHPNHAFISSEDVEGTSVNDKKGNRIGEIDHLMIDKVSGRVNYAVMSFGGLLGLDHKHYPLPWAKIRYDKTVDGFRTDVNEQQLRDAPESAMIPGKAVTGKTGFMNITMFRPIGDF
jgi:hypothetical protein